jgi:hypothetical protein
MINPNKCERNNIKNINKMHPIKFPHTYRMLALKHGLGLRFGLAHQYYFFILFYFFIFYFLQIQLQ